MTSPLPYDRSKLLTPNNHLFEADLERFLLGAYYSDMASGDVTTGAIREYDREITGRIVAKQKGVFCGGPLLKWFVSKVSPEVRIKSMADEGGGFVKNDEVVTLLGRGKNLLKMERTVMNFLQRFCAVATETEKYVKVAGQCPVAATRKTLYGLLDKYAVSVGGGLTHRLHLGDGAIFKDNHWTLVGNSVSHIILGLKELPEDLPFATVEVSSVKEFKALMGALEALDKPLPWPVFLMLDNFSLDNLVVLLGPPFKRPKNVFLEASGGITMKNIKAYAKTDVDVLSVGAITHSIPAIDLSMRLKG